MPGSVENKASAPEKICRSDYLEPSPFESDGGNYVGKDPRKMGKATLGALGGPESPIKAIRAYCIECSGDSVSEARKCVATECPLWRFRMGINPLHKSFKPMER